MCVSAFYLEKKISKGTIDSWIQFGIPTVPWLLMDRSTCDSRWESSACDVDAVHRHACVNLMITADAMGQAASTLPQ